MPGCYSGGGQLAQCWPSITLVHFPGRLTKEQRSQVDASQSMTKCSGCYSQWIDFRTLGGFVFRETNSHDDHESLGQDKYVMLDRWISPVREEEVKSIGKDGKHKTPARDRLDRAQSPPPRFVEEMTALGCTLIETRHMRFNHVIAPTDPYEKKELYAQDIEAKGFDFDWVKGRNVWKTEKKAKMSHMTYGCRRSMNDKPAMKRRMLLAEDRDLDADRQKKRKGLRANGQLKLRQGDYKGMC